MISSGIDKIIPLSENHFIKQGASTYTKNHGSLLCCIGCVFCNKL